MYTYMARRLFITIFAGLLTAMAPSTALSDEMEPATADQVENPGGISVSGQTAYVTGAQGETLEVVSLTGRLVMTAKIDSPNQRVELNIPKGCYILKVGKVVRKIQVH